ncbi:MAG: hypothetical protein AAGG55_17410, partial [Pseudomonadota bacterium]
MVLFDKPCNGAVEFGDLAGEEVNHRLTLRCDFVVPRVVATRLLGLAELDQLPAASEEIRGSSQCRTGSHRDGKVEDRAYLG